MVVTSDFDIDVGGSPMPAYLSKPSGAGPFSAVIVLEGVYGFDDELRRITDLVASSGFVGLAINYFHRADRNFRAEFSEEGRRRGAEMTAKVSKADVCADVAAARDWLSDQDFVKGGHIATWGFGFGGTVAFASATLPGLSAAVAFYGQSIASPMPNGETAPIGDSREIRTPLLLVFGGKDELIGEHDIAEIADKLKAYSKKFEIQVYPNVGHSFFRSEGVVAAREAADAWDRVQSFLRRHFA